MVIRRGDVTDITWVFAQLEKCLITNQRDTTMLIIMAPSNYNYMF